MEASYSDEVSYVFLDDDTFNVKDASSNDQIKQDKEEGKEIFDNEQYTFENLNSKDVEIAQDSSDLPGEHNLIHFFEFRISNKAKI